MVSGDFIDLKGKGYGIYLLFFKLAKPSLWGVLGSRTTLFQGRKLEPSQTKTSKHLA